MKNIYSVFAFFMLLLLLPRNLSADDFQIVSVTSEPTTCYDDSEGSITIIVSGGNPNYQYGWFRTSDFQSGSAVSPDTEYTFTGLPRGNYVIFVNYQGSGEDPLQTVIAVASPPLLYVNITPDPAEACYPDVLFMDGNPTGGTGTYVHEWTGAGSPFLSPIDVADPVFTPPFAGTFPLTYTVTDDNGCQADQSIDVVIYPELDADADVTAHVLCHGENSGEITVSSPSGGTGNYQYMITGYGWQTSPVFPNLYAGSYDVYIRDDSVDGCVVLVESSLTVTEPATPLSGSVDDQTDVSCFGGSDGSVEVSGSGGTPPYQYSINGVDFLFPGTFGSLSAGNYTVTVADANGCTFDVPVTISEPASALSGSVDDQTDVSCFGGSDGSVGVSGSGGTPPYQYSINGVDFFVSGTFGSLSAGNYTVTIADANGCTFDVPVTISEPASALSGSVDDQTDVSCFGGSDGSVGVSGSGGTPPYQYSINGVDFFVSGTFVSLSAGDYTVTIADANGCTFDVPVTISEPASALSGSVDDQTDVSCFGGSDGSVGVSGSGGTPPYQYSINGVDFIFPGTFVSLSAGNYTVTIADANGCTFGVPVTISQPASALSGAIDDFTDITCFGSNDGTITASASGGTSPYLFSLNGGPPQASGFFDLLAGGDYTVSITDTNGCGPLIPDEVTITEPGLLQITGVVDEDIECHGETNGTITVTASGGTGVLEYTLMPDNITNTTGEFDGLPAGTYQVLVDDQNGCGPVSSGDVIISEPDELTVSLLSVTDPLCHGDATGTITVGSAGGTGTRVYTLHPLSISNDTGVFAGLFAGTYQVSVDDDNGCGPVFTGDITVGQPGEFTISATGTDVSCYGAGDGEISVSASGGTGPYEYSIYGDSDPDYQLSGTFSGLGPDTYEVIARDANMCLSNQLVVETDQPNQIFVGFSAPAIETCYGDPGTISLTASGGSGSFEYSVSTTQFVPGTWQLSNVFDNLLGDVAYYAFVRDTDDGCIVNVNAGNSITISQPTEIIYSVTAHQHVTGCSYSDNGLVRISVPTGGTSPYSYYINGADNGSRTFSGLAIGDYLIEVIDSKGCIKPLDISITGPDPVVADSYTLVDVTGCHGNTNGEISLQASGGTGSLEYSINGVDYFGTGDFDNLGAGDHTVTVRDDNACEFSFPFTLTEPDELMAPGIEVLPATCAGAGNTMIRARAVGGTAPFTVTLLLGGAEQDNRTGVAEGEWVEFGSLAENMTDYEVVVDDAGGCGPVSSGPIGTAAPAELLIGTLDHTGNVCFGAAGGAIEIGATGGTPPYTYTLFDDLSNQLDEIVSGAEALFASLPAGTYTVEVDDANGCGPVSSGDIVIVQPPEIVFDAIILSHVTCFGYTDGEIDVTASGGTGTLVYTIDPGGTGNTSGLFGSLPAGIYTVSVTDDEGCGPVVSVSLEIEEPDPWDVQLLTTDVSCSGLADGSVTVQVSGGTAPYEFSIDNWATFQAGNVFDDLSGGNYTVRIRDAGGCEHNAGTVSVTDPDPVVITAETATDDTRCFEEDEPEGTITITAAGGSGALEYSVDGGATFHDNGGIFTGVAGGSYEVVVRDGNGCAVSGSTLTVDQAPFLSVDNIFIEEIICYGYDDGAIIIVASGGTGPLGYSADGGLNFFGSGTFTSLPAGEYIVVVSDGAGCTASDTIMLSQPDEMVFMQVLVSDIIIGSGTGHGSITAEMAGGTLPYSYSADNGVNWQDENMFDNLAAGEYDIMVTDGNGCVADTTVTVEEITGITADITAAGPTCFGYSDGVIAITANLGTEPYRYSIDDGATFFTEGLFAGLSPGTYQVVVTDDVGYVYRETVVLSYPPLLEIYASVTPAWCNSFSDDGAIELTVSGGTGSPSFLWSGGATAEERMDLAPGNYTVVVTDDNGCEAELEIEVGYLHLMEVTLPEEIMICQGETAELTATVVQSGSTALYSWSASVGPDPDPLPAPEVSPQVNTDYSLVVTDENGCRDEAVVTVGIHPLQGISIGNDTLIFQGSSIVLEAEGGVFISYEWAPGIGLSNLSGPVTTATPVNETLYYVFAETAEGCIESDSILIGIVQPVQPVSGFTPNGDGVNDYFDIVNADDYPDIVVEVFTRTGQRVYYSQGYSDDRRWDGSYNGRDLPVGTYYFVITLNDVFGTRPVTGPVTIVR